MCRYFSAPYIYDEKMILVQSNPLKCRYSESNSSATWLSAKTTRIISGKNCIYIDKQNVNPHWHFLERFKKIVDT